MKAGKKCAFIEEVPEDIRPRERLFKEGAQAVSNQELLAILLRTGYHEKNVMALALDILNHFENLYQLKMATLDELMQIKGLGPVKALEIQAMIELGGRLFKSTQFKYGKISGSHDIGERMILELADLQQEHLVALYLNSKNEIIKQETIFIGSVNQSIAHPREIFRGAVRYAAARIILVHNHPSGNPDPSPNDLMFTERMVECGNLMGIEILDHIIVGSQGYYSLREEGEL